MTTATEETPKAKTRQRLLLPEQLRPNPWNRKRFSEDSIDELADSFRQVGQIQAITVRPHPEEKEKYEIVAGERRWRAAQRVDGFELEAKVRDLTDVELVELLTIENAQREDVHELEEAVQYRFLIDNGYDVDLVATKVGKSRSYIYQRLKLSALNDQARELFLDERITAGHAIMIARLPEHVQDIVLDRMFFALRDDFGESYLENVNACDKNAEPLSVRQLDNLIQTDILMNLERVAFYLDDAELVPEAGSCAACVKRTGAQPDLFPSDTTGNNCTDEDCFYRKIARYLEVKHTELSESGEPFLMLEENGMSPTEQRYSGALHRFDWQECKEDAKGAQRSLIVTGPRRGLVLWAKNLRKREKSSTTTDDEWSRRRKEEAKKQRREALIESRVQDELWDRVVATRAEGARTTGSLGLDDMRRLAVRLWCEMRHEHRKAFYKIKGWEDPKGRDKYSKPFDDDGVRRFREMDQAGLCALLVELSFLTVRPDNAYRAKDRETLAEIAKLDKVDEKAIRKQVVAELKEKDKAKAKRTKKSKASKKSASTPEEDTVEMVPSEELEQITGPELISPADAIAAVMKYARRNKLINKARKTVEIAAELDNITGEQIGTRILIVDLEDHIRGNLTYAEPEQTEEVV